MKLLQLHLVAFGPFTGRVLDFERSGPDAGCAPLLHLVCGPNEAGKSSMLRALCDLRFGIPHNSADNYRPEVTMQVGAVLLDGDGRPVALMRRKGRGQTLSYFDPATGAVDTSRSPAPQHEAALTAALTRPDFEAMFGLDHARLRWGGEQLLKGEGEVGAALFEASAGAKSIPAILSALDTRAREFFMPGSRARRGRLNEALSRLAEQRQLYKDALVRPKEWSDLNRRHEEAAAALRRLDEAVLEADRRLQLYTELRAVAPQLDEHDRAVDELQQLADAPLLPPSAAEDRARAQAQLDAALAGMADARRDIERLGAEVLSVDIDTVALAAAGAIERLAVAVQSAEPRRQQRVDAVSARRGLAAEAAALTATFDAGGAPMAAPDPTQVAVVEDTLRTLERAQQQHDAAAAQLEALAAPEHDPLDPLPPDTARAALQAALDGSRSLEQSGPALDTLQADTSTCERQLRQLLHRLQLADVEGLRQVRPLLPAELEVADMAAREAQVELRRIDTEDATLRADLQRVQGGLDRLAAQGELVTRLRVDEARARRDSAWALVRRAHVDRGLSPEAAAAEFARLHAGPGDVSVVAGFESALRLADHLSDLFSADTERATQIQLDSQRVRDMQAARVALAEQRRQAAQAADAAAAAWRARLAAAGLPDTSPAALREWQAELGDALRLADELDTLREQQRAQQARWAAAIDLLQRALDPLPGLGGHAPAPPTGEVPLAARLHTLQAAAARVKADLDQRALRIEGVKGQRVERERQRQLAAQRLAAAQGAVTQAQHALVPHLGWLQLTPAASASVVRARLRQLLRWRELQQALAAADAVIDGHDSALQLLELQASEVAALLGEAWVRGAASAPEQGGTAARLLVDRLQARLEGARHAAERRRALERGLAAAQAALAQHEQQAAAQQALLAQWVAAAGVDSAAQLPDAEARSQRRRDAARMAEEAQRKLRQASSRSVEELRRLLQGHDAAALEQQLRAAADARQALDEPVRQARQAEEAARRALAEIDTSDRAAQAREQMEQAMATVRSGLAPWARLRLAHALLDESLRRFRERAQGPMLSAASGYFARMTGGRYARLSSDDSGERPVLLAHRDDGARITVAQMSEGTRDQLYLALRLAALELHQASGQGMPLVLDDVLMTSDDVRAGRMLQALAAYARGGAGRQVLIFTHHPHLLDLACSSVDDGLLATHEL
ncbi:ATP-binding protein [Caldimonas brevitalea]|uniref:DNA double-strand break repair Rad50 ATPase n=1 Tax=Caldimonas brevitalea TaxID=413882 RepID=A0A0G3BN17_9BURK|nr:YhaN family protein [Caldimonas brevitalea]AKJ29378.1 DNA double-strand break repair Rad50 ATPase [Caldimonas brevitalea]